MLRFGVNKNMGQIKILEKLNKELKRDITEECQVVYILSRIRKMLEMKNQKDKYKLLNFYCNWSLHVNLKYKKTAQIISDMFDRDIDCSESANDIAHRMKFNQAAFFKLNDFKNDLKKFFEDNDLSLSLLNKNKQWIKFVKLLLEIIEDCPVICIESSTKISKIELTKNMNGDYCYKFSLIGCSRKPVLKLKFK